MRKIFMSVVLLFTFGCSKNPSHSPLEIPDRGLLVLSDSDAQKSDISTNACHRFENGTRPTVIRTIGGKNGPPGLTIFSNTEPGGQLTSSKHSGLLLIFTHGNPMFLPVTENDGSVPGQQQLFRIMNQVELMISNATKIEVTCVPATKYTTHDTSALVNFMTYAGDVPKEGDASQIDGIVEIHGVEP